MARAALLRAAAAALLLGGCLSAPEGPAGGGDGGPSDGGGGGDGGGSSNLKLTGVAGRDHITPDQQDDLVLIGTRGGQPRAIVLFGADTDEAALQVAGEIELPSLPRQVVLAPWNAATGAATLLGEDRQLFAFDATLSAAVPLELSGPPEGLEPTAITLVEFPEGKRLLVSDDAHLSITEQLRDPAPPGERPLSVSMLRETGAVFLLESQSKLDRTFIGMVHGAARGIEVLEAMDGVPPALVEMDASQSAPGALERPLWQSLGGGYLHLFGILSPASLWVHTTPMSGDAPTTDNLLEGVYDAIHDILITRVEGAEADLVVLGTIDGELVVHAYLDPLVEGELVLRAPVAWSPPAGSGFRAPGWLQAMECALTEVGVNEIVLYDADGHLFCLQVNAEGEEEEESKIRVVGSLDLSAPPG